MLYNCDALDWVRQCENYDTIFADPPDNLGLSYDTYVDRRSDYYNWLELICGYAIQKSKVFWLSYYWEHDLELKSRIAALLRSRPSKRAKTFIWRYTFGQHNNHDYGSGFRFLLRISSVGWKPVLERVQSERQRLGDKRANPLGRVPDDVWDMPIISDIPRVTGNSRERRSWHPTQHPEALMERIYRTSGGSKVLDLFFGTGTTGKVCDRLGLEWDACELSQGYCDKSGFDWRPF